MLDSSRYKNWTASAHPKILAVDNANAALAILQKMLKNQPYELHCTTSCPEALELCTSDNIDLILLDIEMPEMNGYDLAQKIRSLGQRALILFITAHSMRYDEDRAAALGIVDCLVKPLHLKELLEKLKQYT
jgi:CheY-like chemotaxis protein